ncbi:MAG: carboxypeptidase-like regulatory domain-containing protein [Gemmatimonadaceae bacterium]
MRARLSLRATVRRTLANVCLLAGCMCPEASAQATLGAVEGVARSEDDGSLIPFALIRLQRVVDQQTTLPAGSQQQGITSATGRFRFASVPPGTYRLQLLRIGYRPVLS